MHELSVHTPTYWLIFLDRTCLNSNIKEFPAEDVCAFHRAGTAMQRDKNKFAPSLLHSPLKVSKVCCGPLTCCRLHVEFQWKQKGQAILSPPCPGVVSPCCPCIYPRFGFEKATVPSPTMTANYFWPSFPN